MNARAQALQDLHAAQQDLLTRAAQVWSEQDVFARRAAALGSASVDPVDQAIRALLQASTRLLQASNHLVEITQGAAPEGRKDGCT